MPEDNISISSIRRVSGEDGMHFTGPAACAGAIYLRRFVLFIGVAFSVAVLMLALGGIPHSGAISLVALGLYLSFSLGRVIDSVHEKALRQRTAEERRSLQEERSQLAEERERYLNAVEQLRRERAMRDQESK